MASAVEFFRQRTRGLNTALDTIVGNAACSACRLQISKTLSGKFYTHFNSAGTLTD